MRLAALLALAGLLVLAGCAAPEIGATENPDPQMDAHEDPETDVLGWEDGYWHDESINVTNEDGLNATEREALAARTKARIEEIRGLEFNGSVDISVISRANFSAGGGNHTAEFRRFDNAKFEAMLLIGGGTDALETQEDSLNASVAGYYSPDRNAIVIVSDSETPTFDGEGTLAHELVHALQDQHFALGDREQAETRDGHNGQNGLVEGDPNTVQFAYLDRCGEEWSCIEAPENESDGADPAANVSTPHLGVYVLQFFPYSDGPGFVKTLRDGENWSAVNDAYADPPGSATEVIYPERYRQFEPRNVSLHDDLRDGWTRVEPESRANYARLGQSGLAAMFAYTLYDTYNDSSVVDPRDFLNLAPGGMTVNETDPLNYDLSAVRGWTGDRLHVYKRGDDVAYRWRLTWDDGAAASRFASSYRAILQHWGGVPRGDGHWRLPGSSPFDGDFHVAVSGDTVTIAHADTAAGLTAVAPAAR